VKATNVRKALQQLADPEKAAFFPRYFKTGKVGLRTITPGVAKILARYPKSLRLEGLKSVSPEAARELAKHAGSELWRGKLFYELVRQALTVDPAQLPSLKAV